jgi:hypothetical protein
MTISEINKHETSWLNHIKGKQKYLEYKGSNPFAHLHVDIIDGKYSPKIIENAEPIDYFEVEIGNHLLYSAPLGNAGEYFRELQANWLPYYEDELRVHRLNLCKNACTYDLNHIHIFTRRGLYFQALDILYKAFQEFLQTLFIAKKTYPIAYNKWIKYQIVELLQRPDIYKRLPGILSIGNIESNEINEKEELLRELLDALTND